MGAPLPGWQSRLEPSEESDVWPGDRARPENGSGSVWASAVRQDQVRQLVQFVQEGAPRRDPVIVCGDFNAGPDSDEIRMLTGRAATAAPGKVFYDSWEIAGDSSAGCT